MISHIDEDDLVLHYYGEIADADERVVAAHLGSCAACAENYRRLQRVLSAVEAGASADAPEGLERTVWARLEPSLSEIRRGQQWRGWLILSPAHFALAASVVLLVTAAFFAGRFVQRGHDAVPAPVAAETVRERILRVDLGDHLDRSQMVLVEIVSAAKDRSLDISGERERAEQLVAANRLYRQTALTSGEPRIAEVLDELERVLIEVAASPEQMNASDLDAVSQRIESKGLLFKVRVVSSEVRQRQKPVGGNSSSEDRSKSGKAGSGKREAGSGELT